MFQRLNDSPLDESNLFDTFSEAESYANNNDTAYVGQIIYIKDSDNFVYHLDSNLEIKPICCFDKEATKLLLDYIYIKFKNGNTDEVINEFKSLFEDTFDMPKNQYSSEPWNPNNYNKYQLALRTEYSYEDSHENEIYTDKEYKLETITVEHNGVEEYYRVYTFKDLPTILTVGLVDYLLEVIHMCDTSEMITMRAMFYGANNLININGMNDWNTSKVTDMSYMFSNCNSYNKSIDVSWNTENVTNVKNMFEECNELPAVYMSGSFSNVTDMSQMFTNCRKMRSVMIDSDTHNVTDMSYMFDSCVLLDPYLQASRFNTSNVTSMYAMFSCTSITKTNFNWDVSKVTTMNSMFWECNNLGIADISGWNTESLTNVSNMFSYCANIYIADISNINTSKLTDYSGMFSYCSELKSLDMSNISIISDPYIYTTAYGMFNRTPLLTWENINLSGCDEFTVAKIQAAFDSRW